MTTSLLWMLWTFSAGILLVLLYFFSDSVKNTNVGSLKFFFRAAIFVIGLPVLALTAIVQLVKNRFYVKAILLGAFPNLLRLANQIGLQLNRIWFRKRN